MSQQAKNQILTKLHSLLSRYMLRRVKGAWKLFTDHRWTFISRGNPPATPSLISSVPPDQVHLALPPKVEALVYTPLAPPQVCAPHDMSLCVGPTATVGLSLRPVVGSHNNIIFTRCRTTNDPIDDRFDW